MAPDDQQQSDQHPGEPASIIPADVPEVAGDRCTFTRKPAAPAGFLAWPGSTSLVLLGSAACLLGGLWGVLAPSLGIEDDVASRWQVLGVLSGYVGCLLAGVWAMCRALAGHPDAVAASVVGAALAVGFGVVLGLIAPEHTVSAALAGTAGWLGLVATWRAWSRITGSPGSLIGPVLGLLALWACLWPVVLGHQVVEAASLAGGATPDVAVMAWWTIGWLGLLLIELGLLALAVVGPDPWSGTGPFLGRPAMRWVLALVMLAAAIIALGVQAHVAGLDLLRSDLLPHLALLALIGNELRARAAYGAGRDGTVVAGLAILGALIAVSAPDGSGLVRGSGWAPLLVTALGSAGGLPLLIAVVAVLISGRVVRPGLMVGAVIALAVSLLGLGGHLRLGEAGSLLSGLVAVVAWRTERRELMAMATSGMGGALAFIQPLQDALGAHTAVALSISVAAAVLLAWAAWRPALVGVNTAQLAAWWLGLMGMIGCLRLLDGFEHGRDLHLVVQIPSLLGAGALVAWAAWRRRDTVMGAALAPALIVLAWPLATWLMPRQRAWLAVWAAFGLLGTAVVIAIRRAGAMARARGAATDP
jgi:hypothetical protein